MTANKTGKQGALHVCEDKLHTLPCLDGWHQTEAEEFGWKCEAAETPSCK